MSEVKHIQTSTNMPMFYLATLKGQYSICCCHFLHQGVIPLYSKQLSDQAKSNDNNYVCDIIIVHEMSADAYKNKDYSSSLLMNWNLAGSRASYITFVYVYTCTLTGKPVLYEHVHVVQCCTEGPVLHVDDIHMWLHYCTPIMTGEFSMIL